MMRLRTHVVAGALAAVLVAACDGGPRDLMLGREVCDHCRMTLSEPAFASQLVTDRGRTYVFDSIECMAEFIDHDDGIPADRVRALWVTDFPNPGTWVPVAEAVYLRSETLRSPMGMNLSAYADRAAAEAHRAEHGGEILDWRQVRRVVDETGVRPSGGRHAH